VQLGVGAAMVFFGSLLFSVSSSSQKDKKKEE
jgi:hypothetical protein